jgi:hypothetical protein
MRYIVLPLLIRQFLLHYSYSWLSIVRIELARPVEFCAYKRQTLPVVIVVFVQMWDAIL